MGDMHMLEGTTREVSWTPLPTEHASADAPECVEQRRRIAEAHNPNNDATGWSFPDASNERQGE
jgi:hypothetical protein